MNEETKTDLDARLVGLEFLLGKVLHSIWRVLPDDVFEALATDYKNELGLMPSPGDDPAMADHKASITAEEVARVMDFVRTLRRLARTAT